MGTIDREKEKQEQKLRNRLADRQQQKIGKLRRKQHDQLNAKKIQEGKPIEELSKDSFATFDTAGSDQGAEGGKQDENVIAALDKVRQAKQDAASKMDAKMEELRSQMDSKRAAALEEEELKFQAAIAS